MQFELQVLDGQARVRFAEHGENSTGAYQVRKTINAPLTKLQSLFLSF
jgi:hypothetical protein